MLRLFALLCVLAIQLKPILAQSGFEITINNELDEWLIDGAKDYDGNFVLTGTSSEVDINKSYVHYSAVIMKVDTLGSYMTKTLQYPDTNCGLFNAIVMPDSNYLFAGYIE